MAETDYNPGIDYITPNEVAERLSLHPATVRRAIRDGYLRAIKHYGRVLLDPADVEAYRARTRPTGEKLLHRPPRPREADNTPAPGDAPADVPDEAP